MAKTFELTGLGTGVSTPSPTPAPAAEAPAPSPAAITDTAEPTTDVMTTMLEGGTPEPATPTVTPFESRAGDVMDLITQAGEMKYEGSPYQDQATGLMETIAGSQYESAYADQIQQVLDQIQGAEFTYDLETDPLFQQASGVAQRQVLEEMGERGILPSTVTADRLATAVGELAPLYREQAFTEFQGTQQDRFNLVNTLSVLDNNAYGQYRDNIGDQYNLASYYDNLATQDYDRFVNEVNQMYQTAEWINTLDSQAYNQYSDQLDRDYRNNVFQFEQQQTELQNQRNAVLDAWNNTNERGYVSNEDAIILGVAPGTPSREVRIMAQEKADALALQAKRQKDAIDLANLKYKQEQALIAEKEKNDALTNPETIIRNASPTQLGNYNQIRSSLLSPDNVNTNGDPGQALQYMGQFDGLYEDDNVLGSGLAYVLKVELQSLADSAQYGGTETEETEETLSNNLSAMMSEGYSKDQIINELRTDPYYMNTYGDYELSKAIKNLEDIYGTDVFIPDQVVEE